jgi:drug/metabolite transporter (DMT)-like permease
LDNFENKNTGFRLKYFTMEKITDLRFIIGLFFSLVGALLVILALTGSSAKEFGTSLNQWAGLAMLLFGLVMLWMNHRADRE